MAQTQGAEPAIELSGWRLPGEALQTVKADASAAEQCRGRARSLLEPRAGAWAWTEHQGSSAPYCWSQAGWGSIGDWLGWLYSLASWEAELWKATPLGTQIQAASVVVWELLILHMRQE